MRVKTTVRVTIVYPATDAVVVVVPRALGTVVPLIHSCTLFRIGSTRPRCPKIDTANGAATQTLSEIVVTSSDVAGNASRTKANESRSVWSVEAYATRICNTAPSSNVQEAFSGTVVGKPVALHCCNSITSNIGET